MTVAIFGGQGDVRLTIMVKLSSGQDDVKLKIMIKLF